jgi:peroxiredoxin family protein
MAAPVLLLLHSGEWGARQQAVALALTAAAFGDRVMVALSGPALLARVEGRFDDGAPASAGAARVGSLAAMLGEGRRDLGVEVVACDTAVRLAGLDPARARRHLDGLRSLPDQWAHGAAGRILSF